MLKFVLADSNYLCFLWHPIFDEIRTYVKQHPVNPDDGTVSMIVSQLAGRAPKVRENIAICVHATIIPKINKIIIQSSYNTFEFYRGIEGLSTTYQ